MRVIIADEGGYIGRKLAVRLAQRGDEVTCIVPRLHRSAASAPRMQFLPWEALPAGTWHPQKAGAAYYIAQPNGLPAGEAGREGVRQFAHGIREAGARRLVCVTRWTVTPPSGPCCELLAGAGVPTSEVRVSAVIGHGSPAFEMIRAIVERVPVITCPAWTMSPLQPAAIADVVDYLTEAPLREGETRRLAGSSVETYSTMMAEYARARRLPRWLLPVRLPHRVSLRLAEAVSGLSRGQVESIAAAAGTAANGGGEIERLPTAADEAIACALAGNQLPGVGERLVPEAQRTRHVILRRNGFIVGRWQTVIAAPPTATFAVLEAMGGDRGWLFADELWQARGVLDRALGGPGMSRGRRHPATLEAGDTVDFWRVEKIERGRLLRFRAEMKMPGEAWLQFECADFGGINSAAPHTLLRQTIFWEPRGVSGELYWAAMYPFHLLLFEGMHQAIASEARRKAHASEERGRSVHLPDTKDSRSLAAIESPT